MITHCDMCGSKIVDNRCGCGEWKTPEEMKDNPFQKALEHFHEMKQFIISGDAPHLGCAFVFFRGDFNDCDQVKELIKAMKNRPFYKDEK